MGLDESSGGEEGLVASFDWGVIWCGDMGDFSDSDVLGGLVVGSPSFALRWGLTILPSTWAGATTGEEAWPLLRCLLDGMPRADARLLAMDELTSRGGRWVAGRLCDWVRYEEASLALGYSGDWGCCGVDLVSVVASGIFVTGCELWNFSS